jgi:hypothetical protein
MHDLAYMIFAVVACIALSVGFMALWVIVLRYNLSFLRLWRVARRKRDVAGMFGVFTVTSWVFGDASQQISDATQVLLIETRRRLHLAFNLFLTYVVTFCVILVLLLLFAPSRQEATKPVEPTGTSPSTADPLSNTDPVERLVIRLSRNGYWANGLTLGIPLPASARPDEVVKVVIDRDFGRQSYEVLRTEEVTIGNSVKDRYTAVLVRTKGGLKIILMRYHSVGWWSRTFDG